MKRKLYVLFFLLLSLGIFTGVKVLATDNSGKVLVDKTSSKDDFTYGRSTNINLEVKGNEYNKYQDIEIVFVLDRSSSMDEDRKMQITKTSSVDIINKILPNDNIKIGLVTFGTDVINNYSTDSLINDKDNLISLINSIPNDSKVINDKGLGTNISSALEYANDLFTDKENSKSIILLSDGEATFFNYNNTTYGTGNSDSSVCVKKENKRCILEYTPSSYAKLISDNIKGNGIKIYGIGFDADEDTKELLTDISDKYYSANNSSELVSNFNDILETITIIGKDLVITDIVPSYFTIDKENLLKDYPNAIITNNIDGTTTIKFRLDKLSTMETYNFNYKVYTKEDYYGYIYTNKNAVIEGRSLVSGVYENDKITEIFPKPIVEIPSVTKDDNYTVKLGETLDIDKETGILINDYLNLINDNDSKISDRIVINSTNSSCGTLNVNDNGGFIYVPEVSCLNKDVTFTYYIETKINDKIVKSNTSNIVINVLKDDIKIINPNIKKDGTLNITNNEELVSYNIKYNTIIDKYLGNAIVTIIDYLPCEIDESESILEGAIYDRDKLTLTWKINVNDIDTYSNGKKLIDINKNIKLKYIDIINYRKLTNKVEAILDTNEKTNKVEDTFDTNINISGRVIVSYIDNKNNKLLEDKIITDLVNNNYLTKEEKLDDYVLVEIQGDTTGKIELTDKYVTYVYYKNSANYSEDLIKSGTIKIDNFDNRIDYNIKYETTIDNYIGEVEVVIIDYLPYKIDLDNSILDGFIYNEIDNTLIYTYQDNIDTYKNGSYDINIDKNITLKYLDIGEYDRVIKNKVESRLTTNETNTLEDECITNIEIKSDVIVEYVDTFGNKLDKDIVITNLIGNDYVTEKRDIKGYTLKEIKGEVTGKHTKEDIHVSYIYEKNKLVPPKTGGGRLNYTSILMVIVSVATSIIFKKKINSL